MSAEDNKALVRRIFQEFWDQKNLAIADELVETNHTNHTPGDRPGLPSGLEGFKQLAIAYLTAFPDLQVTIVEQVAEENTVVTHWTAQGTNTGSLFGTPATNKIATVVGITINRIAGGKIVESWTQFDHLGMYQQLGVLSTLS